ncbi:hypothetical protein PENARI_c020G06576 [Penicillium arizonense]|uniref:Cytochrome P450 n=1 Tax=Penicillium arizonense TaxID=1835702 RepID=A0A1F5L9T8_PENAI|nr:hypothetical protein PENARI_c020G06576 [Penicillium arizonense]OGE49760.1 hypothetical protein PENARI_c020G06576 [Penicillium arizonense]
MLACFLFGSAVAYNLVMIIYRLHFHSLSRFPGPRLAAATGLYEIYFSAWGPGFFENEIDQMHQRYGPVVRITPDEVHVQEPFGSNYADCWIKGTRALESGRPLRHTHFQIRKRSISRVRSLIRVEVNQIISGLIEKHQVHKVYSARLPPFIPLSRAQNPVRGDVEDDVPVSDILSTSGTRGN